MTFDVHRIWNDVDAKLRSVLNEDTYDRWIAEIVPIEIVDNEFKLGVSNDIFKEWLSNNYTDLIENAVNEVASANLMVYFESGYKKAAGSRDSEAEAKTSAPSIETNNANVVSPQPLTNQVRAQQASSKPATPRAAGEPAYNKRFTFDRFVVGENNELAYNAARAVADSPGSAYNPLFIHSPTGLGKTHLLQGIAWEMHTKRMNARIEYLTSEEFTNNFISALRDNQLPQFRRHYRSVDLLLIDDVHFFTGKNQMQEEFFHTFNSLFNEHRQVVLTSDRPPHQIGGLEKRLVSRFEWGLTTDMLTPDFETRVAILSKKQLEHKIVFEPEILQFVAQSIRSNIRHLEGALIRLVSMASMMSKQMTLERAEKLLQPLIEQELSQNVTVDGIQRYVAETMNITHADMLSKKRPKHIARPRQIAMYLAREITHESLPTIASKFNRNHGTVVHAITSIDKEMKTDADFRRMVKRLSQEVKSSN